MRRDTRILSLDTTSEFGSLALVEADRLVAQVALHSADGFGHVLFPEVEALLAGAGWTLRSVDCFAAASGPGSFTGIRVGLAAVKGLGEALGRPVVAVSNLQAIAWHGSAPLRAALIDAHRGEVYGGVYSDALEVVQREMVTGLGNWLRGLPEGEIELLSTDFNLFSGALTAYTATRLRPKDVPRTLAGAIAHIAFRHFTSGLASRPEALDANYVRRSDAELLWKEW